MGRLWSKAGNDGCSVVRALIWHTADSTLSLNWTGEHQLDIFYISLGVFVPVRSYFVLYPKH